MRAAAAPAPIAVPARPLDLFATLTLALAAVLPPIGFVALPELIGLIGPLPTAASLIGAVVLAPAAVGVVAALIGLGQVRARFAARGDKEHEYAVCRVLGQTLLFAWAFGLAAIDRGSPAPASCLLIAILALVGGWSFLLHLILSPRASAARRYAAIVIDIVLLSAFLHFGAGATAIWYPAYLAIAFYAGFRFGFGALVTAAAGGVVGFGAVAAMTPVWQAQPGLAAGLALMLAAMPGGVAALIRALARSREEADAASVAQARFLHMLGRGLRGPVDAMARALPGAETGAEPALPAQALLAQISEVLDLAAIETGSFAPDIQPFDLHGVVNDTLALLRPAAARRGIALSLRLDPFVPYRLSGWPQQFAQILNSLVIAAIAASDGGTIRIEIRAAGSFDAVVPLRLSVRGPGGGAETEFDLVVVGRLAELMGGHVAAEGPVAWTVSLPLALDAMAPAPLDLAQRPVLLVTEDSQFAGELAEPLGAWNADTRWVGGLDDALVYVERFETPLSPVLIVDGRVRVIPALSFVHRAALVRDDPLPIIFVAEAAQIGALAGIGDGELAGLLPSPVSDRMLENALHALPTIPIQPMPAAVEQAASAVAYAESDDRVTPIAAHPRYAAEPAAAVDARVIAGLRNLSGGGNFLAEIVDSFRSDSRQIMDRIAAAADAGDLNAFARGIHALRRCAATVGGTGLCELALSLRGLTAPELHQQDAAIVQRLAAELARFNSALVEFLPRAG